MEAEVIGEQLFVLRTVTEKAATEGKPDMRDLALLFLDLSKAYDCVSHKALWEKLEEIGMDGKLVSVLKALYKHSSVRIMVNGHLSEEVLYQRGIKTGLCFVSAALYLIYGGSRFSVRRP